MAAAIVAIVAFFAVITMPLWLPYTLPKGARK